MLYILSLPKEDIVTLFWVYDPIDTVDQVGLNPGEILKRLF